MRNIMLFGALGLGAVAAIVTFLIIGRRGPADGAKGDEGPTVQVEQITAVVPLYPHTLIRPEMVEAKSVEKDAADPSSCQSLDEVIDHVVLRQVGPGEVLYRDNVSGSQGSTTRPVVSFEVPKTKRAYAVLIDPALGAGGLVQVGDLVDVLCVYDWDAERSLCRTVAQLCQVVHTELVGEPKARKEAESTESGAEAPTEPKEEIGPKKTQTPAPGTIQMKVVLAVDPEQAQEIAAANQKGEIALTIRNAEDLDELPIEPSYEHPKKLKSQAEIEDEQQRRSESRGGQAFADALRQIASAQQSVPLPAPVTGGTVEPLEKTVDVIRGTERETVTVSE